MTTTNTLFKSETVFGLCLECDTRSPTHLDLSPLKAFGTRFIACPYCGEGAIEVITKPSSTMMFEWNLKSSTTDLELHQNLLNMITDSLKIWEKDKENKHYKKYLEDYQKQEAHVIRLKDKVEMMQQLINTINGENQ